jgi:hypothetical protein
VIQASGWGAWVSLANSGGGSNFFNLCPQYRNHPPPPEILALPPLSGCQREKRAPIGGDHWRGAQAHLGVDRDGGSTEARDREKVERALDHACKHDRRPVRGIKRAETVARDQPGISAQRRDLINATIRLVRDLCSIRRKDRGKTPLAFHA